MNHYLIILLPNSWFLSYFPVTNKDAINVLYIYSFILVLLFKWKIFFCEWITRKRVCIFLILLSKSVRNHISTSSIWECPFPHIPKSSNCLLSFIFANLISPKGYQIVVTLICNSLAPHEGGILASFSVFSGHVGLALI